MAHFKDGMPPIHPGEILREEFLVPLDMSANALALALRVTAARINEIVREQRGIRRTRHCGWRAISAAMRVRG